MSDNCNHHEGCGHDHLGNDLGPQDSLFSQIDRPNVIALNGAHKGSVVIKPWNEREDNSQYLESDADDQLILRIPFTSNVRLRSLLLKAGPGGKTPEKITLYANAPHLDFESVNDRNPSQELEIVQGNSVGEYPLRTVKFNNVSNLTLFVPAAQGDDVTRISYVGFLGHWTKRNEAPVVTVYEAQANLADHEKIQGMDGTYSNVGH
ncbi:thioredoxin Trp26 family protein [Coprinopsis marcescibilis]|uniref:Thioredoxin Trp26 family protein n=1 Tax=Coprinopsis marcescibilis TaxID=230819 RepID=A0A5C3KUX3_COPMA|nr:thioredoxin Trp26 family protein [Coprinopsis marcescibilis]